MQEQEVVRRGTSISTYQFFKRDGENILYDLPINFAQAALGTEVEVPTLHGDVKLKIPAGSQSGQLFNLKNKGVPHLHGRGQGEQIIRLVIVTPESLTKRQRQLFEELAEELGTKKKS
jgi:molecular chaperone DnaJ